MSTFQATVQNPRRTAISPERRRKWAGLIRAFRHGGGCEDVIFLAEVMSLITGQATTFSGTGATYDMLGTGGESWSLGSGSLQVSRRRSAETNESWQSTDVSTDETSVAGLPAGRFLGWDGTYGLWGLHLEIGGLSPEEHVALAALAQEMYESVDIRPNVPPVAIPPVSDPSRSDDAHPEHALPVAPTVTIDAAPARPPREGPPLAGWPFSSGEARQRQKAGAAALGIPAAVRVTLAPAVFLDLVLVPAGAYLMGSTRWPDAGPVHAVRLTRPFFLGRTPVTQAQWQAVRGDNPSRFPGDGARPVEEVTWEQATGFVGALARSTGLAFRLPTEAEWEWACRAGTAGPFGVGRPGQEGNPFHAAGIMTWDIWEMPSTETVPVGGYPPNAWGLLDAHGNVAEWCADWYAPYAPGAVEDPLGPATGIFKVVRGGSHAAAPALCDSSSRHSHAPDYGDATTGLRVALTASDVRTLASVTRACAVFPRRRAPRREARGS
jgi:formylglycine-generating enzyme